MQVRLYEINTGIETSVQPDAGTPTLANDLITKGYADANYSSSGADKADRIALLTTDTSKTVTFVTPFPALTEYEVYAWFTNTVDAAVGQNKMPINTTGQSVAAFTATWDNQVGNGNTFLSWIAKVKNNS